MPRFKYTLRGNLTLKGADETITREMLMNAIKNTNTPPESLRILKSLTIHSIEKEQNETVHNSNDEDLCECEECEEARAKAQEEYENDNEECDCGDEDCSICGAKF